MPELDDDDYENAYDNQQQQQEKQPINFKTHHPLVFGVQFTLNSIGSNAFSLRCPYNRNSKGPKTKCDAFVRVLAETRRIEGKKSYEVLQPRHLLLEFKGHNVSCKLDAKTKATQNKQLIDLFVDQMMTLKMKSAITDLFAFFEKAPVMNRIPYVRLNADQLAACNSELLIVNLKENVKFLDFVPN